MRKELRMIKPEFNLLDEPWIRVRTRDCRIEEVSLKDVFVHAHEYEDLAGETAAQDVAMLRLLLAVLHCTFSRVDENGEENLLFDLEDDELEDEVFRRWKALYDLGHFPEEPIQDYLEQWRERFWLFHEERPFWQATSAEAGTEYEVSKLNGEISESSNKLRLFSTRAGEGKKVLSNAEAARWLLYLNGFDDTSAKPKKKGLPSPGAGWLGKLGIITAAGKTLFETLLLNLTLLKDGSKAWQQENIAVWEKEKAPYKEREEIQLPENQAELLTLQSRRLLLHRADEFSVDGFTLLGGDFFPKESAATEQMTLWGRTADKKIIQYQPRRHRAGIQMWREFASIFCAEEGTYLPGIVRWNQALYKNARLGEKQQCNFRIVSVQYGDKDFFVNDAFEDRLSFAAGLLTEMQQNSGGAWLSRIKSEVESCDKLAGIVGGLAKDLTIAAGNDTGGSAFPDARETCYAALDFPFRAWLNSIEPSSLGEAMEEKILEWQRQAKERALVLGRELTRNAGLVAMVGREQGEVYYSAPKAFESMVRKINKLYPALRSVNKN
ncbi:type I-E CRISPR-associated protein Cse1/CasA [Stomatobaculum longum]|uniref:type I-E CRISPR-associated protein Cse1/CasA n=1 Tax=Stomatobaculum longum TaxID=796942 RepID=UPI0028043F77|nr:type I-E CRISPR-associated protein Cse1/CasA [Stomatobaculum longum]